MESTPQIEEWRDISDYKGLYKVSSLGRVEGLSSGKILKGWTDRIGYRYVRLSKNSVQKVFTISRLVAFAFHGLCPEDMECAHLDGTKDNNVVGNLKWVTHTENMSHIIDHGSRDTKLTSENVVEIKRRYFGGETQRSIACDFPINRSMVGHIVTGKYWK